MSEQYGFPYPTLDALKQKFADLKVTVPFSGDVSPLKKPVTGEGFTLPNALAVQPMEGADGKLDGGPSELTYRRYERFAKGGAGLLWVEAVAVTPEARANPNQLWITEKNIGEFKKLADDARENARKTCGHTPVLVVQLTHSGRWSRPEEHMHKYQPIRAWSDATLDKHQSLPEDWPIITDDELKALPEKFAHAAKLCKEAGFDAVDVKACHLYLYSELLGARERPAPYGGSLENRARAMLDSVDACNAYKSKDFFIASRFNVHDNTAGHWGNGEGLCVDLSEPLLLAKWLKERGVKLMNITMGTPYFNPHINRPYSTGGYAPPEDPMLGVARLLSGCKAMQEVNPDVVCVATGMSYLRQFGGEVAAGLVGEGWARAVGFGRQAFAYPDFASDILGGGLKKEKTCLACGKCTKIMRAHKVTGCPVRDQEIYLPLLRSIQ